LVGIAQNCGAEHVLRLPLAWPLGFNVENMNPDQGKQLAKLRLRRLGVEDRLPRSADMLPDYRKRPALLVVGGSFVEGLTRGQVSCPTEDGREVTPDWLRANGRCD
jgi:hypothetical protein